MGLHYYDFNLIQTKVNIDNANRNLNYKIIDINNTMFFQLIFERKKYNKE